MFDTAAMGTLLIGLDADQAQIQGHRRGRPVPARPRELPVRLAFARFLRRAAALVEPRMVGELADQGR